MLGDVEKIKELEYQINKIQDAYGKDCAQLYKQPGFDIYSAKSKKKVDELATKYAKLLYPLQKEHSVIRERLNIEEEERRKKKYKE